MPRVRRTLAAVALVAAFAALVLSATVIVGQGWELWDTDADWSAGTFSTTANESGSLVLANAPGTDVDAAAYCAVTGKTNGNAYVDRVQFPGIDRTSGDSGGYLDATASVSSAVKPGGGYTLSVTVESGGATEYVTVVPDYDRDGSLVDETPVQLGTCTGGATCTVTGTLNVPAGATPGSTLMRITNHEGGYWNTPCTSIAGGDRGEFEDYTLSIDTRAASGTHATEWRNTGKNASWNNLVYTVDLPVGTSATATVEVSQDGATVADSQAVGLVNGTVAADLSALKDARYVRISSALSTTDEALTPAVDSYNVTYDRLNTVPTIVSGPTISNYTDRHAFNVSAVARDRDGDTDLASCRVWVDDRDGNTYSYTGTIDAAFGDAEEAACDYSSINASIPGFEVTEVVDTKVQFIDADGADVNTTVASPRIPNRAPGTPQNVGIDDPNPAYVTDLHPNATWTNAGDAENDPYNVSIYVTNSTDPLLLEATVSPPVTTREIGNVVALLTGEDYVLELQACDAWHCSAFSPAYNFHVNQEPLINAAGVNATVYAPGDRGHITANVTDADGTVTEVRFTLWNETAGTRVFQDVTGTQSGDIWTSPTFTAAADGTFYNWTVEATDGYSDALPVSGQFNVGNVIPTIVSGPTLHDYPARHAFNVSAVAKDSSDTDLDNCTVHVADHQGNAYAYPGVLDRTYGDSTEAECTYSNINETIPGFEVGEPLDLYVAFTDLANDTAVTGTVEHTLPNRPPVVSNVSISPAAPRTRDTLTLTWDVTDPDDSPVFTDFITWYKDGVPSNGSAATLSEDHTVEGEQWHAQIYVEDFYGEASAKVNATPVTVQNTPATLVDPIAATPDAVGHGLTFAAKLRDPDGISDLTCRFGRGRSGDWVSGAGTLALNGGFNFTAYCRGTVSAGDAPWIVPGSEVNGTLIAGDEEATFTEGNLTGTIPNHAPTIDLLAPAADAVRTPGNITFSWVADDLDDDNLTYTFRLYEDGALTAERTLERKYTYEVLSAGDYTWSVAVTDSYNGTDLSTVNSGERALTVRRPSTPDDDDDGVTGGADAVPPRVEPVDATGEDGEEPDYDPLRPVELRFRISDRSGVQEVWAEYRSSPWQPARVDQNGSVYTVSFTPEEEGEYTVRLHAIDGRGNERVYERNITVAWERAFAAIPRDLGTRTRALADNRVTFSDLELRNAGESPLTLDLSVSATTVLEDGTTGEADDLRIDLPRNVSLPVNASRILPVVARLDDPVPEREGAYRFRIAVTPVERDVEPVTVTGTAVFARGAFLLTEADLGVLRPGEPTEIPVFVSNQGPAAATDARLSTAAPEGWTVEPADRGLGDIAPNSSRRVTVTVTPAGDAEPGNHTVVFTASTEARDRDFRNEVTVRVSGHDAPVSLPVLIALLAIIAAYLAYSYTHPGAGFPFVTVPGTAEE